MPDITAALDFLFTRCAIDNNSQAYGPNQPGWSLNERAAIELLKGLRSGNLVVVPCAPSEKDRG